MEEVFPHALALAHDGFGNDWVADLHAGSVGWAPLDSSWALHRRHVARATRTGGDPIAFETKYVDLLHRSDSGRWEVAYCIWSDNP